MAFLKFSKGKAIYSIPNGIGDGAYFDGVSSYADLSDKNLPMGNSARSISLWFYKTSKQNEYTNLVRYGTEYSNYSYSIGIDDSGCIETYGCNNTLVYNNEPITLGKWYHVVITFDTDYTEKCYLNGSWIGNQTHSNINTVSGVLSLANWYGVEWFQGNIKNLLVYNRALTAEEVTTLYNKGTVTDGLVLNVPLQYGKDDESMFSSKNFVYDYSTLTTSSGFDEFGYPIRYDVASEAGISYSAVPKLGLSLYAPLNKDVEFTQNGELITKIGNPTFTTVDGIDCVNFNGNSGLAISDTAIDTDGNLTICYKMRYNTINDGALFYIGQANSGTEDLLQMLDYSTEKAMIGTARAEYCHVVNAPITIDKWYNVALVRANGYLKYYVDGVLADSVAWTRPIYKRGEINIGCGYWSGQYTWYFNGCMSKFLVYNRVLTDKEIKALAKEF